MMRPEYQVVPRSSLRQYMTMTGLTNLMQIGGIRASSFILRCANQGRPIPFALHRGSKVWRPIDLIVRAINDGEIVEKAAKRNDVEQYTFLRQEIDRLRHELNGTKHELRCDVASKNLTGKTLLREEEIASAAIQLKESSGVYFLVHQKKVVYVGQSVRVESRIATHIAEGKKKFDSYAILPCPPKSLNTLESLYIHVLRPQYNGRFNGGEAGMCAPLKMNELFNGIAV